MSGAGLTTPVIQADLRLGTDNKDPELSNPMLLQEPTPSPYDLRFNLLGFPIRVAWSFWLGALVFGFGLIQLVQFSLGDRGPGLAALHVLWGLCMLVSILIHELGHSIAFRMCGIESSIVLYHFGGLAIPRDSFGGGGRSYSQLTASQELWIALAGPAFQLASAAILIGLLKMGDYQVVAFKLMPAGLGNIEWIVQGKPIENAGLFAFSIFYIWPSVLWGLLNLVPVWPLDGGRICRSAVVLGGGNTDQATWISLIAAGLLAAYGFGNDQMFMGILFLSLAITNFQMLQQRGGWRY